MSPSGFFSLLMAVMSCWAAPSLENGKKCDRPDIKHGAIYYDYWFPKDVGRTSDYKCETNYLSHDRRYWARTTCTNLGWDPEPKCSRQCSHLNASFANADLINLQNIYLEGEKVTFRCKDNYETPDKKNDGERTCLPNGEFTPAKCSSKTCNRPDIKHGAIYYDYWYPKVVGRTLDYQCETNYVTHDRRYWGRTTCTKVGWDPEPKCSRQCSYRKTYIENADLVNVQSTYLEGEKVKFLCKNNSETPDGRNNGERTCLPNGEFTPAKCSRMCKAPGLTNGEFKPNKNNFEVGEYLRYECNKGYMTEGRNLVGSAQCLIGQWSEVPRCIAITCKYGDVTCKDGDVIKYTCPSGKWPTSDAGQCYYYGWGPPHNCQEKKPDRPDAQPDDSDKQEKRQKCPPAYNPKNAEIKDPKEEYYDKDTVTMACVGGYKMYGSPLVQCIEGKWEQPPECIHFVKVLCDEAPEVTHATVVEKKEAFKHGEKAKYKCENGFQFSGEDSARCSGGKWLNVPTCVTTSCKPPPTLQNSTINGQVKDSYKSGEKVVYSCKSGHSLRRSLTGEALCENTNWTNLPMCGKIGEHCGPPPIIQFGDTLTFSKTSYKSGEYVEYKCPDYYILKGNRTVRCLDGVWDEAPVCLEPCTTREKDIEENNIQLRWKDEKKLYSQHGDIVEFLCKSEYEAPPGTQMRILCEQGKLIYPKCFKKGFCVLDQSTMTTNNIQYHVSAIVDYGETITFQCIEGTKPENKLEAKCEEKKINYPKCIIPK